MNSISRTTRRFVVINDQIDDGMYFCGLESNYFTALGRVMNSIFEFKESYEDDGDEFSYTDPILMEGDGGEFIEVTFKGKTWESPEKERWYILYDDGSEHREEDE